MPEKRRGAPTWFPRLTLRGGVFLGGGAPLLLNALLSGRRDLLFIAFLLLAIPLSAAVYVSIRPVRLRVHRAFRPSIVPAGGDTVVALSVRNLSGRPILGLRWRDTGAPGLTMPPGMLLPGLDGYEGGPETGPDAARLEYRLTPGQRGLYSCGPLLLARSDPFGLAVSEWTAGEPHDLTVTPRVTVLPVRRLSGSLGDGDSHERLRHLNHNADELIAREYRPGDSLRRVNWPATARHGEIMVRQEEQRNNSAARLVLDTALRGRLEPAAGQGVERMFRRDQAFELAIELTASLGVHLLQGGYRIEFIELGPSQLAAEGGGLPAGPPAGPPAGFRGGFRGGLRGDAPSVFRAPGGVHALLEGLAGLVPVDPPPPDGDEGSGTDPAKLAPTIGGTEPTLAVLVDVDERDVADLVALGGRSRPALAFLLETVNRDAAARLGAAGWHCVPLRSARDIPRAWQEGLDRWGAVHEPA